MGRNKIQFILLILSFMISGSIYSQSADRIAFINSDEILAQMPGIDKAKAEVNDLNTKYKNELQLMQNEYNKKYSDFISYQTSMAENIRLRRMQELYELEQQINKFMEVAQNDVLSREEELLTPLRTSLKEVIYQVGIEDNFVCIYDLANPTILFVTPNAIDITALVKARLGIK